MPVVFMSDKEAAAIVVVLESYLASYPTSCTADMIRKVPDRIAVCIERQGKKKEKAATPKDSD